MLLIAIGLVFWSGMLFPPALAVYALVKWRGGWRLAAVLPLVITAGFFAPMIPDWIRDPSAHSLWGLLFIPLAMLQSLYCGVVVILWRRKNKRPTSVSAA